MKIYLAGKMQGIPQFNFPLFYNEAAKLRAAGHTVFNPAQRDVTMFGEAPFLNSRDGSLPLPGIEFSLREALRDDTNFICMEADAIALLPGWEKSNGARAEHALAVALDLKIIYL